MPEGAAGRNELTTSSDPTGTGSTITRVVVNDDENNTGTD